MNNNIVFSSTNEIDVEQSKQKSTVHIRAQQRTAIRYITTVQGLSSDLDFKQILKMMRKKFATNGTIIENQNLGKIIQLQGDVRVKAKELLVEQKICEESQVNVHGF